jgi:C2 domain
MPSTVKVRVKGARNLPPMDNRRPMANTVTSPMSGLFHPSTYINVGPPSIDAYVVVSLGGHSSNLIASTNVANEDDRGHKSFDSNSNSKTNTTSSKGYTAKTKTCRRSLNPVWDEEFRFDVTADSMLQDEPLIFRVCDWDAMQSDESIGLVYIDLNPLLSIQAAREDEDSHRDGSALRLDAWKGGISTGVIDGWFPLYDTLGGVRGELGLSIKLTYIGDVNIFRDSSAGVRLLPFSTLDPVAGFKISHVFGFVEELVVASDPEFQWNDDFKRAKTSHETRQTLLYLLDSCVRRRMCKTVLDVRKE